MIPNFTRNGLQYEPSPNCKLIIGFTALWDRLISVHVQKDFRRPPFCAVILSRQNLHTIPGVWLIKDHGVLKIRLPHKNSDIPFFVVVYPYIPWIISYFYIIPFINRIWIEWNPLWWSNIPFIFPWSHMWWLSHYHFLHRSWHLFHLLCGDWKMGWPWMTHHGDSFMIIYVYLYHL